MEKITIRLMGGLGNQLFQYAFGKQISKKYSMELVLDTSSYLRKGSRPYNLESYAINDRVLSHCEALYYNSCYYADLKLGVSSRHIIHEKETFQYEDVSVGSNNYYVGFWQNEKYFENIRKDLLHALIWKGNCDDKAKQLLEEIKCNDSVAVHIRRGDYLLKGYADIYVAQDILYYERARAYLNSNKNDLKFYIFSDDIEWCKQNFMWDNCYFVDDSITADSVTQFEIMRSCKHFIIANSTYSWWAAWLAENKDAIRVAPRRWYVDEKVNENCKRALLNSFMEI